MKRIYKTADEAFRCLYDDINNDGIDFSNQDFILTIGIELTTVWGRGWLAGWRKLCVNVKTSRKTNA